MCKLVRMCARLRVGPVSRPGQSTILPLWPVMVCVLTPSTRRRNNMFPDGLEPPTLRLLTVGSNQVS